MKIETFFDNFEMLAEAPNGVKKLREMILELAVRGKLVAQDAKDEQATFLLRKIKFEKERLIKEKKIKKHEPLPLLTENNVPHQIPSSWQWISLGEVIDYNSGQKVFPNEMPKDAWLLDLEDIEKDTSKIIQRLTAKERESKSTKTKFEKGDVLYGKLRPYLNKVVVADADGFCTTEIVPLRIYYGISSKFLMYALKRPDFLSYVNSKTYGVKMPRLGTNDARSAPFPLPPLPEQHRIVSKVDQLMSLCNELEARQQKKRETRAHINSAALDRLLAARAPGEFEQGWRRISDNFDLLYDAPENVGALRQAIIELAIRGKIVEQNPKDEPGSSLLIKIKAEKARLIKEKKVRPYRIKESIDVEQIPFDVPDNWIWCKLEEIINIISGNAFKSEDFNKQSGIRAIKITNVGVREFIETNEYLPTNLFEIFPEYVVNTGDILIALTRPYISEGLKVCICPIDYNISLLNQRVAALKNFFGGFSGSVKKFGVEEDSIIYR